MCAKSKNVLIYLRTHIDDPCECGVFGVCDCMGKMRNYDYDAVIGIGGKRPYKGCEGIAGKVNWVGVGIRRRDSSVIGKKCSGKTKGFRGPLIIFDSFCLMNENGPKLEKIEIAPELANHISGKKRWRLGMSKNLPKELQKEICNIIKKYSNCPSSKDKCQCGQS